MTINNPSHSLNMLPFLSEEVEGTLRRLAWKDENFREALIADPKGVIQRLFLQSFPAGKLPQQLTINVIEEDPGTCHIVLPFLPDEVPTLEIPEEEHLELLANMGAGDGSLRRTDSSEKRGSQSPEQRTPGFLEQEYKRRQQAGETKENTLVSENHHDSREPAKLPTEKEWKQALFELSQNKQHIQDIQKLAEKDPNMAVQMFFKEYLPNHQLPQCVDFKIIQRKQDAHYIVLPSSDDNFGAPRGVPKDTWQSELIQSRDGTCGNSCGGTCHSCGCCTVSNILKEEM